MKKQSLSLFFAFLFAWHLHPPSLSASESIPDLVKLIKPSVVTIVTFDRHGRRLKLGTGFFLARGVVASTRHVLEGGQRAEIRMSDGREVPIRGMLAEEQNSDLILIEVDGAQVDTPPLTVVSHLPVPGEKVIVLGSPLGLEQTLSDGIVSAIRDLPNIGRVIQITAPISTGSSGSPVVNLNGEVIGIATMQMEEGQNLNFAVPGARLLEIQSTHPVRTLAHWNAQSTQALLKNPEKLFNHGLAQIKNDQYAEALAYFERATIQQPQFTEAWFYIGFCLGEIGRLKESIRATKQAIELDPYFAEAYYNLGLAYAKLGDWRAAHKAFTTSIDLKPDYAFAHLNLGYAYLAVGDIKAALKEYKILLNLDQKLAESLFGVMEQ